jgi:hypothetical protein
MTHFDETSRWMEWSKNGFSHRLTPEPPSSQAAALASAKPPAQPGWEQRQMALAVPLSRFTSQVGSGSDF